MNDIDPVQFNQALAVICLFTINLVFTVRLAYAHCNFVRSQRAWNNVVMGWIAENVMDKLKEEWTDADGEVDEAIVKLFEEGPPSA